jgi:DNA polymerase III epsilon subunit-like protein
MTRICAIDTETTSLRPDRRAWEVGIVVRDPGQPDVEYQWLVDDDDLDLGNADPKSLAIGRFYERHPFGIAKRTETTPFATAECTVMLEVERITRGAHLVGAVVSFDADVLGKRMRAHGICPSWHYHLIDVEALAVGATAHAAARDGFGRELAGSITALPWKSEALSRALGVEPDEFDRHTALGDARWAMAIYDAVMEGAA